MANSKDGLNVVLKAHANIGSVSAEEDSHFLTSCFVQTTGYESIVDLESSKCVLLGRTGAGKSAIIQRILSEKEHSVQVDPRSLSLNYIANSKYLRLMDELGVDLDIFYQLIWRHVLAIELIQCKQGFESEAKAKNFFGNLHTRFENSKKKKRALEQLEKYSNNNLSSGTSERVVSIINKLEADLEARLDLSKHGVPLTIGGGLKLSKETKSELVDSAQQVINGIDIRGLGEIINLLADDVFEDPQQEFYILIDELDEKWVDSGLKYHLIRALIESIKKFRKVRRAKIVISLREDLLEKVLKETRFGGDQEEKFEDLYLRIKWKIEDLRRLVEERISFLFQDKYTTRGVTFSDVFPYKVQEEAPFNYLIDRTLLRPRDIIQFINYCLESSEGQTKVSARTIREAEAIYSRKRHAALLQEWEIVNPLTDVYFNMLDGKKSKFKITDLTKDDADNFTISLLEQAGNFSFDPVFTAAKDYLNVKISRRSFQRSCIQELYKIGVLGIKNSNNPCAWSYLDGPLLSSNEIRDESAIFIHPMLWRHLGVHLQNISPLNIRRL